MASDQAKQIVDQIFGDEKAKAVDSVQDALAAKAYDAIQQRKLEFAKTMGFELDDTAQDAADEVADNLPDGTEAPPQKKNLLTQHLLQSIHLLLNKNQ